MKANITVQHTNGFDFDYEADDSFVDDQTFRVRCDRTIDIFPVEKIDRVIIQMPDEWDPDATEEDATE